MQNIPHIHKNTSNSNTNVNATFTIECWGKKKRKKRHEPAAPRPGSNTAKMMEIHSDISHKYTNTHTHNTHTHTESGICGFRPNYSNFPDTTKQHRMRLSIVDHHSDGEHTPAFL